MQSLHSEGYRKVLTHLVAARHAAGMTQAQVAAALKVPASRISRMESGERRIDVVELLAFAKLYGKSLAYFVRGV